MANAIFDKARESFISQSPSIALGTDTIKVALVRGYTPSASTHQYLSDVTGGGGGTIVATSGALASKTVTAGVFDAADVVLTAVPSGAACNHLVLYKDTGVAGTSPLVAYLDTGSGLPVTPNGADVTLAWDNTAGVKIFKI